MHDDPALSWLCAAEPLWAGHHSALAARLARPAAARLTEEQEALALGLAQRLVQGLAAALPLASEAKDIWARWETGGMPDSAALAPSLMARAEEYRWRRHQPQAFAVAAAPLFQPRIEIVDAVIAASEVDAEPSEVEAAYLHLRVADGRRSNAIGQPLLLHSELPPAALRALMLDIAAQDLALIGDGQGRAADLAHAIDGVLAAHGTDSIDTAAHRYHAALQADQAVGEAAAVALARRDWLAVVALLSAAERAGFSRVAAALLASNDAQIVTALRRIGVDVAAAGPLLDALADVPGRPDHGLLPATGNIGQNTMTAVAARAAQLRENGA